MKTGSLQIEGREKDLGGFTVRRVLPYAKRRMVGPWIFFDHLGPAQFEAGQGINVRPHPHINLATVTYLFDGEILHRDSVGSVQAIRPGDINLMVAGRGIVHSEREREEVHSRTHNIHALQLWHALPEKDEECDPAFYHYPAADLPLVTVGDVTVRVMIGEAYGVTSPVKTFCETLYASAELTSGQMLLLPDSPECALYVADGEVALDGESIAAHNMYVLTDGEREPPLLTATEDSTIVVIGGEPFTERFIEWNFVSSRKERIEQAKDDWKHQRFDKVPGDDEEYIPLPE